MLSSDTTIPIVDLGKLAVGFKGDVDEAEWRRVGEALVGALSSVGFAYLTNHGIEEDKSQAVVDAAAAVFALPTEVKEAHSKDLTLNHGYVALHREKLNKFGDELRESFEIRCIEGRFPSEVPSFRDALRPFTASCVDLTKHILTALALGLGLPRDYFESRHQELLSSSYTNSSIVRINHYPPLPNTPLPHNTVRCGAHTDYGSITLLFQDSAGGLQVRSMDGAWMDAVPIPGTILLNVGDLLEMWTAKRLVATEHRVVAPKDAGEAASPRYSIAFFVHPEDNVLVQSTDGSSTVPPITAHQHLLNMFAKTYNY